MMNMEKIIVKILGPEIPCRNCTTTQKNVEEAVKRLAFPDFEFDVRHDYIASEENVEKFGRLRSPAAVANDYVLFQGEVPPVEKIVKKLEDLVNLL